MKKWIFLIMMGILNLVNGSEEVTVQVISAVYEKSVTHAFDAQLKKTGLEIHKQIEAGRYVVTLGSYKDEKSAETALKKARLFVNKGAFIRPVHRVESVATAHHVNSVASVAHDTHTSNATEETPPHNNTTSATPSSVTIVEAPSHEILAVVPVVSASVTPANTTPAQSEKRDTRRNEISDAINFYKTSPYHRFEPVTLRQ